MRSMLSGNVNPSLVDLKHLTHLDLSGNDFQGIRIPKYLGSLKNLRYLNLSGAEFAGIIPHQLGNLSNLRCLDLSWSEYALQVHSFSWLSGLSLLEHLDLSQMNLNKASDCWVFGLRHLVIMDLSSNQFEGQIPNRLGNLTSLRHLDLSANKFNSTTAGWLSKFNHLEFLSLSSNGLQGTISSIGLENLTSIKTIDLSLNFELGGPIPTSFVRLCELTSIDVSDVKLSQDLSQVLDILSACGASALESLVLSSSQISGHLTSQLGQFKSLRTLSLDDNCISGPLPPALGDLSSLTRLDLSRNMLNGSIPLSLGKISHLEYLDLSNNKMNGTLSEIHFVNLTKLTWFSASGNSLILQVNPYWVPPFQLKTLLLMSCHLGPQFPSWLHSQKNLSVLDISNARISDTIPRWFWNSIFQYEYLNISSNQIYDVANNSLSGTMPGCVNNFSAMATIDSSHQSNAMSYFEVTAYDYEVLEDASIVMKGSMVEYNSILNLVRIIDVSKNNFSGEIPMELTYLRGLQSLNLSHNIFTGQIPENIGNLISIESLDFSTNQLSSKIPQNGSISSIITYCLSTYHLVGIQIPSYLGSLKNLRYLNLSGAEFAGVIPHQLGNISNLQYLDLSKSYYELQVESISWLSGLSFLEHLDLSLVDLTKSSDGLVTINSLPSLKVLKLSYCELHHFPSLPSTNFSSLKALDLSGNHFNNSLFQYSSWVFGLRNLVFFDLSDNEFHGKIPSGLGNLTFLRHLDLSSNEFNSAIPGWLSKLNDLEFLSLRGNSLQGTISSMGLEKLTSIKTLDLSFNVELGGQIPTSFVRLCKLTSIDVSYVKLGQDLSQVLDIFSSCGAYALESLVLSGCHICGHLTNQLGQFKSLHTLELRDNSLSGPLPPALGELSSMKNLDLFNNTLDGAIPMSLGQLSHLELLDLSNNRLNGTLSEIHFVNLTKLTSFSAFGNSLIFKVNQSWVPPFQLEKLRLRSCHLGPQFPSWLRSQKHLFILDISNTRISDTIPRWFWNSISHLSGIIPRCINNFTAMAAANSPDQDNAISYIRGGVSDVFEDASVVTKGFMVEYNTILNLVRIMDISNNNFSGEVPKELTNLMGLQSLNFSHNLFTGKIPENIGNMRSIESLDFSMNQLSGKVPQIPYKSLKFDFNQSTLPIEPLGKMNHST
ncbi:hypothetical protein WN944_027512 [Citrus x changshan-huyou]|uniref:Uncharacterized protein n=1 Tax=Citrus x changshan-huyou TaxID=2935761 RepID=A0AAP0Q8K4_9ROSI